MLRGRPADQAQVGGLAHSQRLVHVAVRVHVGRHRPAQGQAAREQHGASVSRASLTPTGILQVNQGLSVRQLSFLTSVTFTQRQNLRLQAGGGQSAVLLKCSPGDQKPWKPQFSAPLQMDGVKPPAQRGLGSGGRAAHHAAETGAARPDSELRGCPVSALDRAERALLPSGPRGRPDAELSITPEAPWKALHVVCSEASNRDWGQGPRSPTLLSCCRRHPLGDLTCPSPFTG